MKIHIQDRHYTDYTLCGLELKNLPVYLPATEYTIVHKEFFEGDEKSKLYCKHCLNALSRKYLIHIEPREFYDGGGSKTLCGSVSEYQPMYPKRLNETELRDIVEATKNGKFVPKDFFDRPCCLYCQQRIKTIYEASPKRSVVELLKFLPKAPRANKVVRQILWGYYNGYTVSTAITYELDHSTWTNWLRRTVEARLEYLEKFGLVQKVKSVGGGKTWNLVEKT